MEFESPWAFLLVFLLPLLIWLRAWQNARGAIPFSSVAEAAFVGRSRRQRFSSIPFWMRGLAVVLLVICLARPRQGFERVEAVRHGVAIQMVLDRSPSMAEQMDFRGQRMNRLDVAKKILAEFVLGNGENLKGRSDDLVGLVSFAAFADTVCPLTLAHNVFPALLETVSFNEGSTAIGDAIALGAARLQAAEDASKQQAGSGRWRHEIQSKVLILLTDGGNNAGRRAPLAAARMAADWGIKVHAIGIGGNPRLPIPGLDVDAALLNELAKITGGLFRMAEDADGLMAICQEIDQLERGRIEVSHHREYKELFRYIGLIALALICAETLLNATYFRRIP
jgi:Ca-activated chloride channel homolog